MSVENGRFETGRAVWRGEFAALVRLGAPMALTQLAQFSVTTIDVLMIGRLGPEPLAASALGLVIFFGAWLFGVGPAMAVTPLVSQALGADRDNFDDVRVSVRMCLWAIALGFLPLEIFFLFSEQFALALGQPPAMAAQAAPYVLALAPGLPFALGVIALRNFLGAIEKTRAPLIIIVVMTGLNAFLNWLLIYGHWGFPRLELIGAGIASAVAHAAGFAALVWYIGANARARRFNLFRDMFRPHWPRLREVWRLGWPISIAMVFEGMLFNASVFLMGRIGVYEVAAYQVALNVAAIAFMAPFGFSLAGGVRVGLAAGAGDWARVRRAAALTIALCIGAIMLIALPVMAIPHVVAGLYLDRGDAGNAAVLDLVAGFLRIAAAFMVFDATQVAVSQLLRALKDVRLPMVMTGIAYWLVGFPTAAYLGLATPVGAYGVWWGLLAGLATAALLLGGRLWRLTRRR